MKFIEYIFPRQCIACSIPGAYLCKSCKKKLHPHPEICPYCHRSSKDYLSCIDCKTNKENYLEGLIIPFIYTSLLKRLIIKLKYFHKKDIGGFLIERLAIALEANESFQKKVHNIQSSTLNPQLYITYIPSHWYRQYFIKGYNQSELLAKKLSEKIHIPIVSIAKKQKHTKTQAGLDRNGRLHNLTNAFSIRKHLPFRGNETLLIIDDVTTTGSTINQLAKVVKQSYPRIKIRGAVLGRHI